MPSRFTGRLALAALAVAALAPALAGDALVAAFNDNRIGRYDGTTGALINIYVPSGVTSPHSMIVGPDCNLYVGSFSGDAVLRFSTATEPTGAPLPSSTGGAGTAEFVAAGAGGLNAVGGMDFGPDGNLYVSGVLSNNVLRYDGITGAFIDVFVSAGSGGVNGPELLQFGPDGHLYVPSLNTGAILRYDGTTGAPLPGPSGPVGSAQFVVAGSLGSPHDFVFGPNGNIYAASLGTSQIIEFDATTGALVGVVAAATSPHGIALSPTGTLLTQSLASQLIPEFTTGGASLGTFISGAGVFGGSADLVFVPDACDFPVPVPDGSFGTPMTARRNNATGSAIRVFWDVTTCRETNYRLLHGPLDQVSSYNLVGGYCGLGTTGASLWFGVPANDLFFVIVSDDGAGTEGSWGVDSAGNERAGVTPSGLCTNSLRENAGSCPPVP